MLHFINRLASLQTDKNLQTDYDTYTVPSSDSKHDSQITNFSLSFHKGDFIPFHLFTTKNFAVKFMLEISFQFQKSAEFFFNPT